MEKQININPSGERIVIENKQGQEPLSTAFNTSNISGSIQNPSLFFEYLRTRKIIFSQSIESDFLHPETWYKCRHYIYEDCILLVDRKQASIELKLSAHSPYPDRVTGRLISNDGLAAFGINKAGHFWGPKDLSRFLKRNKRFITTDVNQVIHNLSNLKFNIQSEVERLDDSRGNKLEHVQTKLQTDLLLSFELLIPLFHGERPERFTVEINIEAETTSKISLWLDSPQLDELIEVRKEKILKREVDVFQGKIPVVYI